MGNLLSGEGGVEEQPVPHEVAMAVLEQLDWKSRAHLLSLDRRWAFDIARDPQTWHVMCERLEIEHGVFVPRLDPARRSEWKEVFQKMAAFHALQESGAENTFAIKVCVRFRPLAPRRAPAAGAAGAPVDKAKHIAILKSLLVRKQVWNRLRPSRPGSPLIRAVRRASFQPFYVPRRLRTIMPFGCFSTEKIRSHVAHRLRA